jgi:hypothetical protein
MPTIYTVPDDASEDARVYIGPERGIILIADTVTSPPQLLRRGREPAR